MASRLNRQGSGACFELEHAPCDSHWPEDGDWIETPFQATVRGISASHGRFTLDTVIDRLSSSQLAVRLPYEMIIDQPLFVFVSLVVVPQPNRVRSGVAVRASVVCAEQRPGGIWRITLKFTRQRFFYTSAV